MKEFIFLWFLAMAALENFVFRFQSVFCPPTSALKISLKNRKRENSTVSRMNIRMTYNQCLVAERLLQNLEGLKLKLVAKYILIDIAVNHQVSD